MKGFTLLEVLLTMGIMAVITILVTLFGIDILQLQTTLNDSVAKQQEVTIAAATIMRELRSPVTSANGSYAIESASSVSLNFYGEVDGDVAVEKVRYFFSGTTLKRGVTDPSGNPATYPPANEVTKDLVLDVLFSPISTKSLFVYYGNDYTGTQPPLAAPINPQTIRLIQLTIISDKTPTDIKGRFEYSSIEKIRTLSQ